MTAKQKILEAARRKASSLRRRTDGLYDFDVEGRVHVPLPHAEAIHARARTIGGIVAKEMGLDPDVWVQTWITKDINDINTMVKMLPSKAKD